MASKARQWQINAPLDIVAGHAGTLFHGPRTERGVETIWKCCSAWEVMWYLAMHFAPLLPSCTATSSQMWGGGCERFVRAVAPLRAFTAALTRVRLPRHFTLDRQCGATTTIVTPLPPSIKAAPASDAHDATTAVQRAEQGIEAVWIDVHDRAGAQLLALLLEVLFERAQAVPGGCGDIYDKPVWAIGLVNLTSHMALPCVMDVKVGYIRDSPFTDAAKRARIAGKQAHALTRQLALRFCGAHYYAVTPGVSTSSRPSSSCGTGATRGALHEVRVDKSRGYALTTVEQFDQRVHDFFGATCPDRSSRARATRARLAAVRAELQALLHYFSATVEGRHVLQMMALVSSSLLFVYDAQRADGTTAHVRLIDFGRSSARHLNYNETHIGFVDGLRSMVACLTRGMQ